MDLDQLNRLRLPVNNIVTQWLSGTDVFTDLLRLDTLHPQVSGNKWFKLKHLIDLVKESRWKGIVSFGGAWSNHIHALAAVGHYLNIPVTGIIRGEQAQTLSATLQDARRWGMQLIFVSRQEYRLLQQPEYQVRLYQYPGIKDCLIVPEGGSGELGVKGCEDILAAGGVNPADYDEIWLPAGTGATAAGLIRSVQNKALVRVIAVLKGAHWLNSSISRYLPTGSRSSWRLECDYHCGGYARTIPELLGFIESFYAETGIPLDHVYTGKMLLALKQMVTAGQIVSGHRILLIHTGGLQGLRGLPGVHQRLCGTARQVGGQG